MFHESRRAFTLIELLIVIAVIAILAGILLPVLFTVKENAKRKVCKAEIETLTLALESYRHEFGLFPPDVGEGSETTSLVIFLDHDPRNGGPRNGFFDFKFDRVTPSLEYLDSWGEPYHYDELASERLSGPGDPDRTPPAKVRTQTFDLWSRAGRPEEESVDWITNYRNE